MSGGGAVLKCTEIELHFENFMSEYIYHQKCR